MKHILERLCRPETPDAARALSDTELKTALESAGRELKRRGWHISKLGAMEKFSIQRIQ